MKKLVAFALMAVMTISLLTGCGEKTPAEQHLKRTKQKTLIPVRRQRIRMEDHPIQSTHWQRRYR